MSVKIAIEAQIEAMKAVLVAEEMRSKGHVLREDVTQAEADDWMAKLGAIMTTLEWCQSYKRASRP